MKNKMLPLVTTLFAFCVSACNQTTSSTATITSSSSGSSTISQTSEQVSSAISSSASKSSNTTSSSKSSSVNSSSSVAKSSSSSSSSGVKPSSSSTPSSSTNTNRPDNVTIDIFPFNDVHGNVIDTQGKGIDISKTTTFIKQKIQNKNAIIISQGDMWQGSVESNYTKGNLVTEWMNQLGFVSMTVGNHEYDWGSQYIVDNQKLANFPTLGINVLNRSNNQRVDYLSSSITFERGGAKIGVIGAIGNCLNSISSSKVKDIYFAYGSALTNMVKQEANRLRNDEKCDFIIYSIHGDTREESDTYDVSLSNDHYVDLVLEGHSHQSYAFKDDGGVYHIQNKGNNESLYQITVDLNLKNNAYTVNEPTYYNTSYSSSYANLAKDTATEAIINKYYDKFSFAYEPLGTIDGFKDPNTLRSKTADLYLEEGMKKWGNQYNIILGGGYMSCRGSGLNAGTVTYSDLDNLFPFDNDIELCSVKGSDLKRTQYITGASTYFVTWSNYGTSVKDNLDDNTTYYLVTDTYSSDYSYNRLTVVDTLEPGIYARDLLARYIQNGGWAYVPPSNNHAGTINDPKTIEEALDYAREHPGSSATNAGADWLYFKGIVTRQAYQISDTTGDMNNVYVADSLSSQDMQIYYLKRNRNRSPNWSSIDDLKVGDEIFFCGQAFYYNNRYLEFASGTYCLTINGVSTD